MERQKAEEREKGRRQDWGDRIRAKTETTKHNSKACDGSRNTNLIQAELTNVFLPLTHLQLPCIPIVIVITAGWREWDEVLCVDVAEVRHEGRGQLTRLQRLLERGNGEHVGTVPPNCLENTLPQPAGWMIWVWCVCVRVCVCLCVCVCVCVCLCVCLPACECKGGLTLGCS